MCCVSLVQNQFFISCQKIFQMIAPVFDLVFSCSPFGNQKFQIQLKKRSIFHLLFKRLGTPLNILFGLTLTVTSPTLQTPSGVDVLTINKKKNKCVQSIKGSRLSLAKKAGDVRVGVYVQKGLNTQQRGLSFWDLYFSYTYSIAIVLLHICPTVY